MWTQCSYCTSPPLALRLSAQDGYVFAGESARTHAGQRQQGWQRSVRLSYLEVYGSQVLDSVLPSLALWA